MRFPKLVLFAAATVALAAPVWSQDSAQQRGLFGAPEIAAQQAQVRALLEQIARQRPVQAESAAREMVRRLQLEQQMLDSLRARSAGTTAPRWCARWSRRSSGMHSGRSNGAHSSKTRRATHHAATPPAIKPNTAPNAPNSELPRTPATVPTMKLTRALSSFMDSPGGAPQPRSR